jgi:hypothetical protein
LTDEVRKAETVVTQETYQEFVDSKLAVAAPAEPVVAPETKEPEAKEDAKEEAEPEEKQEKKPNPKIERRFSELTEARKAAEAREKAQTERAEKAEREAAELRTKLEPPKVEADAEPKRDAFQNDEEYEKARVDYLVDKRLQEKDAKESKAKAEAERERVITTWQERVAAVKTEITDYQEKIAGATVMVSDEVRDAIMESDVGPKILYHFAEHPEDAERIGKLTVGKALKELGKIEARLEVAAKAAPKSEPDTKVVPKVEISKAPAPISPLKGGSPVVDVPVDSNGEFKGSFAKYKELRTAGKIK